MQHMIERYRTSGSWFSRAAGAHDRATVLLDGDCRLFCSTATPSVLLDGDAVCSARRRLPSVLLDGDGRPRPDGMLVGRAAASLAAAF
ncbi:hypothetical protein [Nocardia sp. NPDC046763]|uniref:hypothetical protein n=1 Tax=Nocardia sp. NPDC046763 TaxID=3155256 RepID=UPI0034047506